MAYYLGIDLGTTYTAAAAEREGVVEALTLGNRTASVPSVVFLRDDGEILVGETATRRATTDPGRVAREFKRRVGDPTPIILGGTPYAAEMLMARLLRWSVDRVREQQGEDPRAIALTHPANWGPYKLDLFTQAVRQVDLDAALLLAEPVAAATFYASQRSLAAESVVAVYDLGGGTFDAAVVRRNAHGFEMVGTPEGMERLGGIDFDEAVFAHVRNAVGDALDRLDPEEPAAQAAVARLRQECIDAKEALSSDTDVSIPVLLPGLQTEVRLTRSEFEAMIRPAISETIVALRRAIRSASVKSEEISAVLLVGGSSRIPLVAQMVGAELGRPIAIDAHPKDAISFGAAIAVAEKRGAATPESVTTVLADSRPPPPTVSSDGTRRPAPPGAGGVAAGGPRPPAPGQRPAPPGAPGGGRPSGFAPPGGAPARPAAPGSPLRPVAAPLGQPAAPAARPAAPAAPAARPAAPGAASAPPAPAARANPSAPAAPSRPGGTAGTGPARPAATPSGPSTPLGAARPNPGSAAGAPPVRPGAAPGASSGERPVSSPPGRAPAPGSGPTDARRAAPPTGAPGAARPGQPTTGGYRPFAASGGTPAGGTPYGGVPRAGGTPVGGHSSGSYPAMPVHKGGAADNKVLWIVLGVVAAIALIVIIAVAMSGDDESGGGGGGSGGGTAEYTAAEEQEFMDACVPGAGDAVCTCAWTGITESISYERFVEIETELRELGADVAPEDLPQDLVSIMTECAGAS